MFNNEALSEILESLSKNKLRTILTGFAVAWGIFIFIVLLGMGNGVENAMNINFGKDAKNKITISGGVTSEMYKGLQKGRSIRLYNEDAEVLGKYFDEVKGYSSSYWFGSKTFNYKDKIGTYRLIGSGIEGQVTDNVKVLQGRFLNAIDLVQNRKVVVLAKTPFEELFGKEGKTEGKHVKIDGTPFQVIGVVEYNQSWENSRAYMPISTAQRMYNAGSSRVHDIELIVEATPQKSESITERIRNIFSRKYEFSPDDKRALWIDNNMEDYQRSMGVIVGIKFFVGLIGILTLISGITGISNIMLISVKERTREIGIRKALGAKPRSIVQQIILESVFITSVAGYIGLVLGTILVSIIAMFMQNPVNSPFYNPTVNFGLAITATVVLIISGAVAGWLPARKAAKIKPIEALRYE